mgnify:CR=1 FL=1
MSNQVKEFNDYRSKMNEKLLADNNKIIKRIFNLDTNAYAAGALDVKTKELLGLVAWAVLRCGRQQGRSYGNFGHSYPCRWHYSSPPLEKSLRILGGIGKTRRLKNLQYLSPN